jgi:hypothetical protein
MKLRDSIWLDLGLALFCMSVGIAIGAILEKVYG